MEIAQPIIPSDLREESPRPLNLNVHSPCGHVGRLNCIASNHEQDAMNTEELFEEMKASVAAACREKNHSIAVQAAERSGFHTFPTSGTSQVFADLRYKDYSGTEIWLVAKWHDPSGPFQNLPDINRIRLTLKVPGRPPVEYMDEYED